MTDTRYLVHGVFWDGPAPAPAPAPAPRTAPAPGSGQPDGGLPVLRLQDPDGNFTNITLDAGTRLGFKLAAGGKSCLGRHLVHGPADRDHILCPERGPAVKGSQCERCFVLDDSRLVHDFHRGGRVPSGLRAYVMQPHWLYIATFAGKASKVGTASNPRKWNRLASRARRGPLHRTRRGRPRGPDS